MTLPLYRCQPPPESRNAHAGLWYDKFCSKWRTEGGMWTLAPAPRDTKAPSPKLQWIQTVEGSVGDKQQIQEAVDRLANLVCANQGRIWVFRTHSRFVTGLGRGHPVENGFAWHPTLGTPYLPGSSVKGMLRAWARQDGAHAIDRIFGPDGPGQAGGTGRILFFDALPLRPVSLEADVMTPHYHPWSEEDPPGDWRSPNPVPFLAVAAESPFLFAAVPRPGNPTADKDLDLVETWIKDALSWAGAGAKTSVGYGRMERDEELTKSQRQAVAERQNKARQALLIAAMSPFDRKIKELRQKAKSAETSLDVILRQELLNKTWTAPGERKEVARLAKQEMEKQGTWRPESRKSAKDKAHQRTRYFIKILQE